ncbi:transcriptional regulator MntR [Caldanaerobius polysaccharolyticus]|uniref:transcriptional regulator MntR n=1 Tax=Caldanaerobius polysaccharolyticus TaxID=44256 RepID=UPI00047CE2FB|nr:transcriptional regulator MntR [Caldanaerobius polysaccharolyticus]
MQEDEFYTFREYMKREENTLTASMEDYLEMIYRLCAHTPYTRINELAAALNVQPPSATKMVQKLSDLNLIDYRKYGIITLTEKGQQIGKALLKRHEIIKEFLSLIGITDSILEETEKIEHTISDETLKKLNELVSFFKSNPHIIAMFHNYKKP